MKCVSMTLFLRFLTIAEFDTVNEHPPFIYRGIFFRTVFGASRICARVFGGATPV